MTKKNEYMDLYRDHLNAIQYPNNPTSLRAFKERIKNGWDIQKAVNTPRDEKKVTHKTMDEILQKAQKKLKKKKEVEIHLPKELADKIKYCKDGNMIRANFDNFINLQESPVGFGKTKNEALADLLENNQKPKSEATRNKKPAEAKKEKEHSIGVFRIDHYTNHTETIVRKASWIDYIFAGFVVLYALSIIIDVMDAMR